MTWSPSRERSSGKGGHPSAGQESAKLGVGAPGTRTVRMWSGTAMGKTCSNPVSGNGKDLGAMCVRTRP